jgi:hypothetical protein
VPADAHPTPSVVCATRHRRPEGPFPLLIGSIGATRVGVLWFAGMILLGLLWLATQPPYQLGRGMSGIFVRPGRGQWRIVNLHRTHG